MDAQVEEDVRTASTYEVLAVRYGTLRSTRRELYASYDGYGEPDAPMQLDYFFWVVRNASRTVLVDTGFDPAVGRRRGREVTCAPRHGLERLGIDPDSVTHVVLTHFHYDHIGNVELFPQAQIVASAREYQFWTGPRVRARWPVAAGPVEPGEVEALERAERQGRLVLVRDAGDAGLPGLDTLLLSGHTPGQLGVSVRTAGRRVVLASDAAHSYEEYERAMPFHLFTDLEAMYAGLDGLRELAASPDTVVVPGHDPAVMDRFPALSDDTADLAVRLS